MQALFRRGQLKALVDLHSTTEGMGGDLGEEEINVIRGALDLTGKQATVAMTPLEKVGPQKRRFGQVCRTDFTTPRSLQTQIQTVRGKHSLD